MGRVSSSENFSLKMKSVNVKSSKFFVKKNENEKKGRKKWKMKKRVKKKKEFGRYDKKQKREKGNKLLKSWESVEKKNLESSWIIQTFVQFSGVVLLCVHAVVTMQFT